MNIGNTSHSASGETSFPFTWTHNNNGDLIIVMLIDKNSSPGANGATITFNGAAFTRAIYNGDYGTTFGDAYFETYYLKNPAMGSHTLSVHPNVGTTAAAAAISVISGNEVNGKDSDVDVSGTATTVSTTPSASGAGELVIGFAVARASGSLSSLAITGGTSTFTSSFTDSGFYNYIFGYLNSLSSGSGAQTFTATWTGAANLDAIAQAVTIKFNAGGNFFMFMPN